VVDPLTAAERSETDRRLRLRVRRVLAGLPAEDRRLLSLRFRHGRSVQDIAPGAGVGAQGLYRRYDRLVATIRGSVDDEIGSVQ
jgi:DNA-directed RNA polymerase specialized sigma24 family protein